MKKAIAATGMIFALFLLTGCNDDPNNDDANANDTLREDENGDYDNTNTDGNYDADTILMDTTDKRTPM